MSFSKIYQCDVCLETESVCSTLLIGHETILALEIIDSAVKKYVMLLKKLSRTCLTCLQKIGFIKFNLLRDFQTRLSKQITSKQYKTYPHSFIFTTEESRKLKTTSMTDEESGSNYSKDEECTSSATQRVDVLNQGEERLTSEEVGFQEMEESCLNDYNCKCQSCQNKYGSLPLLLQGIEHKSHATNPQPSTSEKKVPKKLLICDHCKKTFTHRGDFNKHMRRHTREKPFPCPVCNRKFAHTSNLQRHQRLHSGYKPFVCDNCDKRFSRRDKLDCHRRGRSCSGTSQSVHLL